MTKYINFFIKSSLNFNAVFVKGLTLRIVSCMIENWKKSLDQCGLDGTLLTDPSKAFECIMHGLFITMLQAYGFDNDTGAFTFQYKYIRHVL